MADRHERYSPEERILIEASKDIIDLQLIEVRSKFDEWADSLELTDEDKALGWASFRMAWTLGYDSGTTGFVFPSIEEIQKHPSHKNANNEAARRIYEAHLDAGGHIFEE